MIFDKLVEILTRVKPNMNADKITMDSKLITDLGIDSLTMMLLAISVEDEFSLRFDNNPDFQTVREICEYVAAKTGMEIGK